MTNAANQTDLRSIKFGVEIETTGRNTEQTAEAIASALGGTARFGGGYYRKYLIQDSKGRDWTCMTDASINGVGTEIVTPPLQYDDVELLQEVVRAARKGGCRVDSSCGIHVHVDGAPFLSRGVGSVVNLVRLFNRYEDIVLRPMLDAGDRMRWCKPVCPTFLRACEGRGMDSFEALNRAWYGTYTARPGHYDNSRYRALNLHNLWFRTGGARTIEFRCFNGTLHAGKIKAYVQFVLATAAKALNATRVSSSKVSFEASWSKYHVNALLKYLGLKGEEFKTCRTHLTALGTGHSGHKTATHMVAWAVRHGRDLETVRKHCPVGFDFDAAVAAARAASSDSAANSLAA